MTSQEITMPSPIEAARYWTGLGRHLERVLQEMDRMLPPAPEGGRGLAEETRQEIQQVIEQAMLAADTAAGYCHRQADSARQQAQATAYAAPGRWA